MTLNASLRVAVTGSGALVVSTNVGLIALADFDPNLLTRVLAGVDDGLEFAALADRLAPQLDERGLVSLLGKLARVDAVAPPTRPLAKDPPMFAPESIAFLGDGALAPRLHEALIACGFCTTHQAAAAFGAVSEARSPSPEIVFAASYGAASSAPGIAGFEREKLEKWMTGRALVICAVATLSYRAVDDLLAVAERCDAFVLFVGAAGGDAIDVGPLVPPGLPNAFGRTFALAAGELRGDMLAAAWRADAVGELSEVTLATAARALIDAGFAATLPLIWEVRKIRGLSVETRSLGIQGLATLKSTSRRFGIDRWLAAAPNETSTTTWRTACERGDLLSVAEMFRSDFADEVYRALRRIDNWSLQAQAFPLFHFHHHNVYDRDEHPPELLTAKLIFNSQTTRRWVEAVSGRDADLVCDLSPSWYMPGDHSLPHTDAAFDRSTAFVWHLTKSWNPTWGGGFFWSANGTTLLPTYNTLHLFNVSEHSLHFVTAVAREARGKRLAVNGWWNSSSAQAAWKVIPRGNG